MGEGEKIVTRTADVGKRTGHSRPMPMGPRQELETEMWKMQRRQGAGSAVHLAGWLPKVLLSWDAVSSPKWAVLAGPRCSAVQQWRPRPGVQSVVRGSTGVGREPIAACMTQKQRPKAPFMAASGNPCVLVEFLWHLASPGHTYGWMDGWMDGPECRGTTRCFIPCACNSVPFPKRPFASKSDTQARLGYLPKWPLLQTGALKHGEKLETVLEAKPQARGMCPLCPTFLAAGEVHPSYPKYVLSNPTSRVPDAFPANSHHTITLST
jgi:hypothetical protein